MIGFIFHILAHNSSAVTVICC